MSDPIKSRPMFHSTACERCVFGSGEHAEWCDESDLPESEMLCYCGHVYVQHHDGYECLACNPGLYACVWFRPPAGRPTEFARSWDDKDGTA